MQDDILHHDDGIVNHQSNGGSESAQRHQVEALIEHPQRDEGDRDGGGNHQARDDGATPIVQEQDQNNSGQTEPDQNGVADAADGVSDEFGLIVERLKIYTFGQGFPNAG